MKEIITKLDKLDDRLDSVDRTLVKQEANLAEHMRRTELLESQHERLYSDLEPVKAHVNQVKAGIKILAFVVPIVGGLVAALYKLLVS